MGQHHNQHNDTRCNKKIQHPALHKDDCCILYCNAECCFWHLDKEISKNSLGWFEKRSKIKDYI
jgi:hypothetical protein